VTLSRTGNHLLITIDATGEVLKVQDHFYSTGSECDKLSSCR